MTTFSPSLLIVAQSLKRREIPLLKQIERSTQGPIADAHLNILLELEALFPENAGIFTGYCICQTEFYKFLAVFCFV